MIEQVVDAGAVVVDEGWEDVLIGFDREGEGKGESASSFDVEDGVDVFNLNGGILWQDGFLPAEVGLYLEEEVHCGAGLNDK